MLPARGLSYHNQPPEQQNNPRLSFPAVKDTGVKAINCLL